MRSTALSGSPVLPPRPNLMRPWCTCTASRAKGRRRAPSVVRAPTRGTLTRLGRVRLGPTEAKERFEASPVARLATADAHGVPHIVPVTFAVDGDVVYFAVDAKPKSTRELRRLCNIEENPRVSLLTDHYAPDWRQLWWARADGRASVWREREQCAGPVALLRAKYPQYEGRPLDGPVVAIEVERWSGWAWGGA